MLYWIDSLKFLKLKIFINKYIINIYKIIFSSLKVLNINKIEKKILYLKMYVRDNIFCCVVKYSLN